MLRISTAMEQEVSAVEEAMSKVRQLHNGVLHLKQDLVTGNGTVTLYIGALTRAINAADSTTVWNYMKQEESAYDNVKFVVQKVFESNADSSILLTMLSFFEKMLRVRPALNDGVIRNLKRDLCFWFMLFAPKMFGSEKEIRRFSIKIFGVLQEITQGVDITTDPNWPTIQDNVKEQYAGMIQTFLKNNDQDSDWSSLWSLLVLMMGRELLYNREALCIFNTLLTIVGDVFRHQHAYTTQTVADGFKCWRLIIDLFFKHRELLKDKHYKLLLNVMKSKPKVDNVVLNIVKARTWWCFIHHLDPEQELFVPTLADFLEFCCTMVVHEEPQFCCEAIALLLGEHLIPTSTYKYQLAKPEFIACSLNRDNFLKLYHKLFALLERLFVTMPYEQYEPSKKTVGLFVSFWTRLLFHISEILKIPTANSHSTDVMKTMLIMIGRVGNDEVINELSRRQALLHLIPRMLEGEYCIPKDVLTSTKYYSGEGLMGGTPALFLTKLLLNRRFFEAKHRDLDYVIVVSDLIKLSVGAPLTGIEYIAKVVKILDDRAKDYDGTKLSHIESVIGIWKTIVTNLTDVLKFGGNIDSSNHDLGWLYTVIVFPVVHYVEQNSVANDSAIGLLEDLLQQVHTSTRNMTLECNEMSECLTARLSCLLNEQPGKLPAVAHAMSQVVSASTAVAHKSREGEGLTSTVELLRRVAELLEGSQLDPKTYLSVANHVCNTVLVIARHWPDTDILFSRLVPVVKTLFDLRGKGDPCDKKLFVNLCRQLWGTHLEKRRHQQSLSAEVKQAIGDLVVMVKELMNKSDNASEGPHGEYSEVEVLDDFENTPAMMYYIPIVPVMPEEPYLPPRRILATRNNANAPLLPGNGVRRVAPKLIASRSLYREADPQQRVSPHSVLPREASAQEVVHFDPLKKSDDDDVVYITSTVAKPEPPMPHVLPIPSNGNVGTSDSMGPVVDASFLPGTDAQEEVKAGVVDMPEATSFKNSHTSLHQRPLTKHQKEMMRRRRDDIPALYGDLTQDTQPESQFGESVSTQDNDTIPEHFSSFKSAVNKSINHDSNMAQEAFVPMTEGATVDLSRPFGGIFQASPSTQRAQGQEEKCTSIFNPSKQEKMLPIQLKKVHPTLITNVVKNTVIAKQEVVKAQIEMNQSSESARKVEEGSKQSVPNSINTKKNCVKGSPTISRKPMQNGPVSETDVKAAISIRGIRVYNPPGKVPGVIHTGSVSLTSKAVIETRVLSAQNMPNTENRVAANSTDVSVSHVMTNKSPAVVTPNKTHVGNTCVVSNISLPSVSSGVVIVRSQAVTAVTAAPAVKSNISSQSVSTLPLADKCLMSRSLQDKCILAVLPTKDNSLAATRTSTSQSHSPQNAVVATVSSANGATSRPTIKVESCRVLSLSSRKQAVAVTPPKIPILGGDTTKEGSVTVDAISNINSKTVQSLSSVAKDTSSNSKCSVIGGTATLVSKNINCTNNTSNTKHTPTILRKASRPLKVDDVNTLPTVNHLDNSKKRSSIMAPLSTKLQNKGDVFSEGLNATNNVEVKQKVVDKDNNRHHTPSQNVGIVVAAEMVQQVELQEIPSDGLIPSNLIAVVSTQVVSSEDPTSKCAEASLAPTNSPKMSLPRNHVSDTQDFVDCSQESIKTVKISLEKLPDIPPGGNAVLPHEGVLSRGPEEGSPIIIHKHAAAPSNSAEIERRAGTRVNLKRQFEEMGQDDVAARSPVKKGTTCPTIGRELEGDSTAAAEKLFCPANGNKTLDFDVDTNANKGETCAMLQHEVKLPERECAVNRAVPNTATQVLAKPAASINVTPDNSPSVQSAEPPKLSLKKRKMDTTSNVTPIKVPKTTKIRVSTSKNPITKFKPKSVGDSSLSASKSKDTATKVVDHSASYKTDVNPPEPVEKLTVVDEAQTASKILKTTTRALESMPANAGLTSFVENPNRDPNVNKGLTRQQRELKNLKIDFAPSALQMPKTRRRKAESDGSEVSDTDSIDSQDHTKIKTRRWKSNIEVETSDGLRRARIGLASLQRTALLTSKVVEVAKSRSVRSSLDQTKLANAPTKCSTKVENILPSEDTGCEKVVLNEESRAVSIGKQTAAVQEGSITKSSVEEPSQEIETQLPMEVTENCSQIVESLPKSTEARDTSSSCIVPSSLEKETQLPMKVTENCRQSVESLPKITEAHDTSSSCIVPSSLVSPTKSCGQSCSSAPAEEKTNVVGNIHVQTQGSPPKPHLPEVICGKSTVDKESYSAIKEKEDVCIVVPNRQVVGPSQRSPTDEDTLEYDLKAKGEGDKIMSPSQSGTDFSPLLAELKHTKLSKSRCFEHESRSQKFMRLGHEKMEENRIKEVNSLFNVEPIRKKLQSNPVSSEVKIDYEKCIQTTTNLNGLNTKKPWTKGEWSPHRRPERPILKMMIPLESRKGRKRVSFPGETVVTKELILPFLENDDEEVSTKKTQASRKKECHLVARNPRRRKIVSAITVEEPKINDSSDVQNSPVRKEIGIPPVALVESKVNDSPGAQNRAKKEIDPPVTVVEPKTNESQDATQELASPAPLVLPKPELLNKQNYFYPQLIDCETPVNDVTQFMVTPTWRNSLSLNLKDDLIETVGDFCRLTAKQIFRLPLKEPKIETARKVLKKYHKCLLEAERLAEERKDVPPSDLELLLTDKTPQDVGRALQSLPNSNDFLSYIFERMSRTQKLHGIDHTYLIKHILGLCDATEIFDALSTDYKKRGISFMETVMQYVSNSNDHIKELVAYGIKELRSEDFVTILLEGATLGTMDLTSKHAANSRITSYVLRQKDCREVLQELEDLGKLNEATKFIVEKVSTEEILAQLGDLGKLCGIDTSKLCKRLVQADIVSHVTRECKTTDICDQLPLPELMKYVIQKAGTSMVLDHIMECGDAEAVFKYTTDKCDPEKLVGHMESSGKVDRFLEAAVTQQKTENVLSHLKNLGHLEQCSEFVCKNVETEKVMSHLKHVGKLEECTNYLVKNVKTDSVLAVVSNNLSDDPVMNGNGLNQLFSSYCKKFGVLNYFENCQDNFKKIIVSCLKNQ